MRNSKAWLRQFKLISYNELDSTNLEAKRILSSAISPSQFVILSKKQTAGKGRHGKKWDSLDGNLFFSIVVQKTAPLNIMTQLSFLSSLAIERTISSLFRKYKKRPKIELKWPNDILIDNKKFSGILLEAAGTQNSHIIIGIGINVAKSPILVDYPTTNLQMEGINFTNIDEILNKIMTNFLKYYYIWISKGFLPIRELWISKAKAIGQIISVKTHQTRITGKFIDIDFHGAIRLELPNQQIYIVTPEEIFFS